MATKEKPKSKRISMAPHAVCYLKIPKDVHDRAMAIAEKEGATVAYVLRKWTVLGFQVLQGKIA